MVTSIVVAVFPSNNTLTRALDYLVENNIVDIKRAAVVSRAKDGETIILDDDLSPNEGALAGGAMGALMATVGVIQLGAFALAGVEPFIVLATGGIAGVLFGGVVGHYLANLIDVGFKNDEIEALSAQLKKGHSALMLELDDASKVLEKLQQELRAFNAEWIETLTQALQNPPAELA